MDELKFKQLLEKYEKGVLSEKESALLEAWLESLGENNQPVAWSDRDKEILKSSILQKITKHDEEHHALSLEQKRSYSKEVVRWAAVGLILVTLSFTLWVITNQDTDNGQLTSVAEGKMSVTKIVLPDGTLVWLKGDSKLSYPQSFSQPVRSVTLVGQALFEVARNPSHPFEVRCGDITTRVLGTSFNITSTHEEIEVAVLTGKVSLATPKDNIALHPNQKAIYTKADERINIITLEKRETSNIVTGTEYYMNFEEILVPELLTRLEVKFSKKINLVDTEMKDCHLTGDFTDKSLEVTLSVISKTLGCTYSIEHDVVNIWGGSCD